MKSYPSTLLKNACIVCILAFISLAGCNDTTTSPQTKTPVATPFYTMPGGGPCVTLGAHPPPPYANIQVSHYTYRSHSEQDRERRCRLDLSRWRQNIRSPCFGDAESNR